MTAIRRNYHLPSIFASILMLMILSACNGMTVTPSVPDQGLIAPMSTEISTPCVTCALTQQKVDADNQAAATAEIVRVNAQAALDSANATLIAVQTQDQSDANVIAAQIAATAEFARANAEATLNSAGSTQSAALTQDSISQTQVAGLATTDAFAASTQTSVANTIATQTQSAAATSESNARQSEEQKQGSTATIWMWCFPIFVLMFVIFVLWGLWRWQKIQQAATMQQAVQNAVDRLPAPAPEVRRHRHDDELPYIESDIVDSGYQVTTPDDQVHQWLDEVKNKLLDNDNKDEEEKNDTTDN